MQGLKVLPTIVDEIARVNEIVDVRTDEWDRRTYARKENRTPMSHHASRGYKNILRKLFASVLLN